MALDATVRARIDAELKHDVEQILSVDSTTPSVIEYALKR